MSKKYLDNVTMKRKGKKLYVQENVPIYLKLKVGYFLVLVSIDIL
jgi:hypothetical protein